MAGGVIAAGFFRVTIALVVSLGVALVVGALGYYVRALKRKVDALEEILEDVGSTEYLRWALDQTDEQDLRPTQDGSAPQRSRHLWLVPAMVLGWVGSRLARQPLATTLAAATAAVVASVASAPSPGDDSWAPPAGAETVPTTAPLELMLDPEGSPAISSSSPTATTTTSSTTTTTIREEEDEQGQAALPSTTTTTVAPQPPVQTTLPPTTTTTVTDKPGQGPPASVPVPDLASPSSLGLP